MEKTTHRQYRLWTYWLRQELNHPSRSDNYLMQIACEVRRVLHKQPARVQLDHFVLEFKPKTKPVMTEEQTVEAEKRAVKQSKSRWLNWLKIKRKK